MSTKLNVSKYCYVSITQLDWPIDKTLSSAASRDESGPWSNSIEGVLHIPQSSSITEASDCIVSYLWRFGAGFFPSEELQPEYYTAIARWAWPCFGGVLPLCRDAVGVFYIHHPWPTGLTNFVGVNSCSKLGLGQLVGQQFPATKAG